MLLLFNLITKAKELIMEGMQSVEQVTAEIVYTGIEVVPGHEGFVMSNQFGAFKLVKRQKFSFYNFTLPKQW
jgi:hypothetical protein